MRAKESNEGGEEKDVLRLLNVIGVSESHRAHVFYKNSGFPDTRQRGKRSLCERSYGSR